MFECVANGSESLRITWNRNHELISKIRSKILITNEGKRSVLRVKKATINDSGIYQCIATNVDNEMVSSKPAALLSKIYFL